MKTQTPIPKHYWHSNDIRLVVHDMLQANGEMTIQQIIWHLEPSTIDETVLRQVLREMNHDGAILDVIQEENFYDAIVVP